MIDWPTLELPPINLFNIKDKMEQDTVVIGEKEYELLVQRNMRLLPVVPKPPLSRMIREGVDILCPKCHSSMAYKYWLFGELKCIHPECGYIARSNG